MILIVDVDSKSSCMILGLLMQEEVEWVEECLCDMQRGNAGCVVRKEQHSLLPDLLIVYIFGWQQFDNHPTAVSRLELSSADRLHLFPAPAQWRRIGKLRWQWDFIYVVVRPVSFEEQNVLQVIAIVLQLHILGTWGERHNWLYRFHWKGRGGISGLSFCLFSLFQFSPLAFQSTSSSSPFLPPLLPL